MKSLSLTAPHAIIMVGIPGSGKTFFAQKFAETFHAPLITAEAVLPYAADNEAATTLIRNFVGELIKTSQTMVLEIGGNTRRERTDFAKSLRKNGYVPLFVWVQVDPETARVRAEKKGMDQATFDEQVRSFKPLHSAENPLVISGKHTYATQAKTVLKRLSGPRAEISSHKQPPARGNIVVR